MNRLDKKLKDLTITECFNRYEEMMKNSDLRWRSAKLLAQNEDYGGAIRDHITSMEEMIKGLIMFMDSQGFQFRTVDGMDTIIRKSHSIRHFIGFTMFIMNIFMDDLKGMIIKIRKAPSTVLKYKGNIKGIEPILKKYALRKFVIIQKEFHWFAKVESLRQEGSHVDYDPQIKSPLNITLEEYKEVYKRLKNVRIVTKDIIKTFDSDDNGGEMIKGIQEFQQEFITEGWYLKMQEPLKLLKKKKNPFDIVQTFFTK